MVRGFPVHWLVDWRARGIVSNITLSCCKCIYHLFLTFHTTPLIHLTEAYINFSFLLISHPSLHKSLTSITLSFGVTKSLTFSSLLSWFTTISHLYCSLSKPILTTISQISSPITKASFQAHSHMLILLTSNKGIFGIFLSTYCIQHCFICRHSDSTVSEDVGIEPSARNYTPSFRENKPKTLVFNDWIRAFWTCLHENAGL
jgi:hypothetical protein